VVQSCQFTTAVMSEIETNSAQAQMRMRRCFLCTMLAVLVRTAETQDSAAPRVAPSKK